MYNRRQQYGNYGNYGGGNNYGQYRKPVQKAKPKKISYKEIGKYFYNHDEFDKTGKYYLGGGAFGKVFRGWKKSDKTAEVAIKVVSGQSLGATSKNEIATWKQLAGKFNHPNILKIYTIYQSKNSMYIVMEYCNDGDLEGYLKKKKKISEDEAIKVLEATIGGLAYLNKFNVLHRDIKPANLIIDKGVYKICDYGLCKVIDPGVY